jgi:hypothetical protein
MRSPRWPLVVLALVAAALFVGNRTTFIGSVPLLIVLAMAVAVSVGGWVALDAIIARLGARRMAAGIVAIAIVAAVGVGVAAGCFAVARLSASSSLRFGALVVAAVTIGMYCRAVIGRRSRAGQLLVATAGISWLSYFGLTILTQPFRDAGIYLDAGRQFLDGHAVYISAPLSSIPDDLTQLPYLYPPFTLPLFAVLALLPHWLGIAILEGACLAAIVAALRLLGVRWVFVPVMLCWPPITIGIQVGNVACFSFLVLALAWRAAAVAPLGGVFKAQTGVLALWLVRERRWRSLATGLGAVAAVALLTLPLTGVQVYWDWLHALGFFQSSLAEWPSLAGNSLQVFVGPALAAVLAVVAVVVALLAGRRDGLARAAVAAVAASPTVYIHGFTLFLPSILLVDAATAWGLLALTPWWTSSWWGAVANIGLLVFGLTRARLATAGAAGAVTEAGDGDDGPFDAALHPLGQLLEPWPDGPAPLRRAVTVVAKA